MGKKISHLLLFFFLALSVIGQNINNVNDSTIKNNATQKIKSNIFFEDIGKNSTSDTLQQDKQINNFFHRLFSQKQKSEKNKDSLNKNKSQENLDSLSLSKNISIDSIKNKAKFRGTAGSSGNIGIGYDYGIIPFAANINYPMGYTHTQGNIDFSLLKLPLGVSYYFSGLRSISGLNNYFRISFDAAKFKENVNEQISIKEQKQIEKLKKLYEEKQEVEQKLYYQKSVKNDNIDFLNASGQADRYKNQEWKINDLSMPDSILKNSILKTIKDSINLPNYKDSINIPSLNKQTNYNTDTINNYSSYLESKDSIDSKIKEYESIIKKYESEIKQTEQDIDKLKNPEKMISKSNQLENEFRDALTSIKKFEIGLCYPNYSTFLINGMPIKGINIEIEKSDYFFAATYGKTINTFLHTNDAVQNVLVNVKNLYNFFEFNNVKENRNVFAFKFGLGRKDETHFHIGILYGLGQDSYITTTNDPIASSKKEKNFVGEVDGKWVINSNQSIDLVYGKSSIQQQDQNLSSSEKGFNALLKSERSHAALFRYSCNIPKIKNKTIFTSRWIDPFFNSYGVGYVRSDNFRYELKTEQTVTKKIKMTAFYRKDEDNLLSLYSYKTILTTIGSNISVKFNRHLSLRAGYMPVLQKIKSTDNAVNTTNKNNIANLMITFMPKIKKFNSVFNALYSYYNLSNENQPIRFQNISINNISTFQKGLRNSISVNYFSSTIPDTLNNNTLILTDEVGYSFKNGANVSLGIKLAQNPMMKNQFGYIAKASSPLVKHFFIELSFEKIIIGDFYNNYDILKIKKFPYYCSSNLLYIW